MILSDREIRAAVARGLIGLEPFPPPPNRWSPSSVDLTLDAELRPWLEPEDVEGIVLDPAGPTFDSLAIVEKFTRPVDCTGGFIIAPHKFVLGWTRERLRLPHTSRIGARVEGKSSLARIGLGVHVTAPTIHPGFGIDETRADYPGSSIRLEIWNTGPLGIRLTKGMPICQILFEEVHGVPEEGYAGQFKVQGPKPSSEGGKAPPKRRRKQ
jgi:dCTP deaminase